MQAMHGRLGDPRDYQALQHFITHSPWDAARVWTQLRTVVPIRAGILALDDTGFPKQGTQSPGVQRQYCGALGKIGNCQVAVSSALIADGRTWPLGVRALSPHVVDGRCGAVRRRRHPADRAFPREVAHRAGAGPDRPAGGLHDHRRRRRCRLRRERRVPRRTRTARPRLRRRDPRRGRVRCRGRGRARCPRRRSPTRRPTTRGRPSPGARAPRARSPREFCALRVRPTAGRGERWLLCERSATDVRKYYLLHLPATTPLVDLVALARSRWPIEQQYRELKDDLGLDHFEGRTYQGWAHHVVLTAVAFTFLQIERGASRRGPTAHAARRARLGPRDHGPALRAPQPPAAPHARQLPPECAATKVTKSRTKPQPRRPSRTVCSCVLVLRKRATCRPG